MLLESLALKIGARVVFADEMGYAGYIEFSNKRRSFFRGTSFDLNPQGASKIAVDKDYCSKILQKLGYDVPDGVLVFSPRFLSPFETKESPYCGSFGGIEAADEYADRVGFPLYVKPNDLSEGRGVSRAYNRHQLFGDIMELFSYTDRVLVQKPVAGRDYRVVALCGEIISAYERVPLSVRGDGRHRMRDLISAKIADLRASGRGKKIDEMDRRIRRELDQQGLTLEDVPNQGDSILLLPNANLSTGGEAVDLSNRIHPEFRDLCTSISRDMGLPLCGIDLLTEDVCSPLRSAVVLEINSAPGLNNFAASGEAERQMVEHLYGKVLLRLEEAPFPESELTPA